MPTSTTVKCPSCGKPVPAPPPPLPPSACPKCFEEVRQEIARKIAALKKGATPTVKED